MRYFFGLSLLILGLAACAPTQPNDGDQYFDHITPDSALLERSSEEQRLAQAESKPPETVLPPVSGDETVTVDLVSNKPGKTKSTTEGDGAISDSQDFKAVSARETIASDAQKLATLKSNYEIVEPGATPTRGSGINLAKYALSQTNPVGQKIYTRVPLNGLRGKRKCEGYISADEAQLDFLNAGGPKNDRRGVDPDGDGYACSWSPETYRALLGQ